MAIFVFTGRVIPEHLSLSIPYAPVVSVSESELCENATFTGRVTQSIATITVETAGFQDWEGLHFHANDLFRSMMDIATLRDGVAWQCTLSEVTKPDGSSSGIVLADRDLASAAQYIREADDDVLFELVLTDLQVNRLMSDAAVMLSWPHYAPIAAGRIVDGLVRLVAGGRTPSHWDTFRTLMRVERAWLQFVTDQAVAPRHGDRRYVSGPDNSQLARRTWTLLDRFIALKIRGALEADAFPLLVDEAKPTET